MITYIENFLTKDLADTYFNSLSNVLPWVRRDSSPRMEAFYSTIGKPYTYGSGGFERTYYPETIMDKSVEQINKLLTGIAEFELCFLNRYLDQSDHLGWHADDSPEIDKNRPIAIVSLGVEREIWFCEIPCYTATRWRPSMESKQLLKHGSLLIMPPGYQQTHYHRIPKSDRICGERISLTYRGASSD